MRRRTLAVLQAAFSATLAACAPPPVVASNDPVPPPEAPTASPAAAPSASPEPSVAAAPAGPPAPAVVEPTAGAFVEVSAEERSPSQLCLGNIVRSLRPGKPVDSLEMRVRRQRGAEVEIVVTGRAGSPCGTAKDHLACQRAFEAAVPTHEGEVFVFTRGEEVGIVERGQMPAFLAPIDTPEEAAAVLMYAPPDAREDLGCEPAAIKATKAGFTSKQERWQRCDRNLLTYTISREGKARLTGTQHILVRPCSMAVPGRRPAGLVSNEASVASLGGYLAEACTLEAASVTSFLRLEEELSVLGAPDTLRRRARRSARDEARHARVMRRLARRAGSEPRTPQFRAIAARPVVAIALENAVEGCVQETWAALVARFQAEHATDPEVRAAMRDIARDEARHAALAWDVRAWLEGRLTSAERALVHGAYERALAALGEESPLALADEDRRALGLPSATTTHALARLWAQAAPT